MQGQFIIFPAHYPICAMPMESNFKGGEDVEFQNTNVEMFCHFIHSIRDIPKSPIQYHVIHQCNFQNYKYFLDFHNIFLHLWNSTHYTIFSIMKK